MRILIVGAGPIGCYVARLLQSSGRGDIDIKLIEEHAEVGRPAHCAGLVSSSVIDKSRINIEDVVINNINGAEFYLNGDNFSIQRKSVAVVIDRIKFDLLLSQGLNIDFGTRFIGVEKRGREYIVEADRGEYSADIVIGADGANSAVRKFISSDNSASFLRGVQFRVKRKIANPSFVQVYFRKKYFAWFIPEDAHISRVGIISDNPHNDLMDLLSDVSQEAEIIEKTAGLVPIGSCQTLKDNLALVGDAACQTKPLTYGGIYYGMRCAEILADSILEGNLDKYESRWKQSFEREISIGSKVKNIYQQLSDDNINRIFILLKENSKVIEEFGDFENHSKVISVLIRNPRLQGLLGKILINIVRDIKI